MKNENDAPIEMDELEPMILAPVSEVTGSGGSGEDDWDNVVWGNF